MKSIQRKPRKAGRMIEVMQAPRLIRRDQKLPTIPLPIHIPLIIQHVSMTNKRLYTQIGDVPMRVTGLKEKSSINIIHLTKYQKMKWIFS